MILKYSHVKNIERQDLITGGEAVTVTIVYADLIEKTAITQNEIIDHIRDKLKGGIEVNEIEKI